MRPVTEALMHLAVRLAMQKIMAVLASRLPFLATGPVGWIVGALLGHLLEKIFPIIFEATEDGIAFMGINIRVGSEHKSYVKAFDKWKKAKTPREIENAEDELDAAFDDFTSLGVMHA